MIRSPPEFVRIRPVELADADALREALIESKAEMIRWFWLPGEIALATPTLEAQRERIAAQVRAREARTAFAFAIVDDRDAALLGGCNPNFIAWQTGFANVGYWVRTSRCRQGIASAAVRQVARFAFEQLGLKRLELVIDLDNAASIRAAEKAGAVLEGVLRNRVGPIAAPRPARMYSLVPDDLRGS